MKKLLCALPLILAGCVSDQVIRDRYYLLPNKVVNKEITPDAPMLIVNTRLSEHLNTPGMVYRTSANQIVAAKHSLWAEGVQAQITQRIVGDLHYKQSHYRPIETNALVDLSNQRKLLISLRRFNGVYTGNAELVGEWLLIDEQGKVLRNKHFQLVVPLKEAGYDALISALSTGLEQLTDSLSKQL